MIMAKRINKGGQPTKYNKELGDEICKDISTSSKGLRKICDGNPKYPNMSTVMDWIFLFPDFAVQYNQAKKNQANVLAEELLDISDNFFKVEETIEEYTTKDNIQSTKITVKDNVARAKLMVETRKWILCHVLPKVYGDVLKLQGDPDAPLTLTVTRLSLEDIDPKDFRK